MEPTAVNTMLHTAFRGTYSPTFRPVHIVDRPCGSGKTSKLLTTFQNDQKYLVVVPTLDEIRRVIEGANIGFVQPNDDGSTKRDSLRELAIDGSNIVTTHALFANIVATATEGLLDDYHIIVDEVLDPVKQLDGKKPRSWEEFYVNGGYATVDASGRVSPTIKWEVEAEDVDDTLDPRLFRLAKAGCLYVVDSKFFMWAMPPDLFTMGRTMTIYTYKAAGSLLLAYLRKLNIPVYHDTDPTIETEFRQQARHLITVKSIKALKDVPLTYTKQIENKRGRGTYEKQVAGALKKLRERELKDIPFANILLTCAKTKWFDEKSGKHQGFAINSRFTEVNWIANTTRGTNIYSHCSHLIYLYDQHPNPFIKRWLGLDGTDINDEYALTELIQWVWRSRVRRGEPITVYIPSARMRRIFNEWLEGKR
jgi:hypothetical protein